MSTAFALAVAAPASAEMVADSGFRPQPDGFSFENYGPGYANLNAVEMQRIYGRKVCLSGKGNNCVLRPRARALMRSINRAMGGGHCYGFAVLAESIYAKSLLPRLGYTSLTQLGAPSPGSTTFEIPFAGNKKVQRAIARAWAFQTLPSVQRKVVKGKPSEILNKLIEELPKGEDAREVWTLAAYDPEGTGGHAVTPYAVDDQGGGVYQIHVYDNNWPGETKLVTVDTNAETWEYEIFPDVTWYGDGENPTMELHPVTPGLKIQPCPVCVGRAGFHSKFNDITLDGAGVEHAHVILRDKQGRRTGIVNGELVEEIPGVQVVRRSGGQLLRDAAGNPALTGVEPIYRVPKGRRVQITIDGRDLEGRERQTLTVVGPTFDATAREIVLDPGERARLVLNPKRQSLRYVPAPTTSDAAVLFGAEARSRKKPKKMLSAYELEVKALGLPQGARFEYRKHVRAGLLRFGHSHEQPARIRYLVRIKEWHSKADNPRSVARVFSLAGKKRHAFLSLNALVRRLGKRPKVVVISDRGKRLPGKPAPKNAKG